MHKTVISDTSCFILLSNIGELEILQKVYGKVITTIEVATEFGESLPEWVEIMAPTDKYRQQILETQIDKGEASAIALAIELPEALIILDDMRARKVAENLKLKVTGTIGVIIRAKLNGTIKSIKPILFKIRQTDFRLSDEVEKEAMKAANE